MVNNIIEEYKEKHMITITFNSEMLEGFDKEDAKQRPKRKRRSLEWMGKKRLGMLPTWNRFLNVNSRILQNSMKQQVSDYTKYIIKQSDIPKLGINRCAIMVKQYAQTQMAYDLDNIHVKSSLDALTHYGIWEDDNIKILEPYIATGSFDKDNPHSEIVIYEITDEYSRNFVLDVMMNDLKQMQLHG